MIPIVHHEDYRIALRRQGITRASKYGALVDLLVGDGLVPREALIRPRAAPRGWLDLAHDPAYVSAVADLRLDTAALRRIGVGRYPALYQRPALSAGGTTLAGRLALEAGLACNTAGGSHHAHHDYGSGYCVFNDVAVAIRVLQADGLIRRALVVDLDVHQGDGTSGIFRHDGDVFTLSVHCGRNFPARKTDGDMDVALDRGTPDAAYMAALMPALARALDVHRPDLVFYNAGVDVHGDDRLGHLGLSEAGIAERDRAVIATTRAAGVPLVTVLGGGYHPDNRVLARRHALAIRAALAQAGRG